MPQANPHQQTTDQQLHERIAALERNAEKELQAIQALNQRIDQVAAKYNALKSAIEQITPQRTKIETSVTKPLVQPVAPVRPSTHPVETNSPSNTPLTAQYAFPYLLPASGGFLALLVLLLLLHFYRKNRQSKPVSAYKADIDEPNTQSPQNPNKAEKGYLQSIQKLAALRKASQRQHETADPSAEKTQPPTAQPIPQQTNKPSLASVPTGISSNAADKLATISDQQLANQNNDNDAIESMKRFLATHSSSEQGWLLLFEMLYHQGLENEFKKQARRFKRSGKFPNTWRQIQKWGHTLEPDEPLYMEEDKRQKRFFAG